MPHSTDRYVIHARRQLLDADQCAMLIDRVEAEARWYAYSLVEPNGSTVRQDIYNLDASAYAGLYDSVYDLALDVNEKCWGFDIDGWQQALRIARYQPGFRHDWHVDYTAEDTSKLAMSVPLNAEYEGGELELLEVLDVKRPGPGEAIFFPAYHGHRVTAVTAGMRYVLLGWFTGPRFR